MLKKLLAEKIVRAMGRNTPNLLRFLAHHITNDHYQWKMLSVLIDDPACKAWLASLENPTRTRRGFEIFTLQNDITSDWIKLHGQHEASTEKFIMEHLKEGSTFLDIGSNIGYFSLLSAYSGKSQVVAFEPQSKVAYLLTKSVAHNRLDKLIRVQTMALSDRRGTMKMSSCPGNTGHAQLVAESDPNGQDELVSICPLDDWLATNPQSKISVCKIDTEGAEYKVICGMKHLLETDGPALVIEIIESHLANFGSTTAQIENVLYGIGYRDASLDYTRSGDHNRYFLKN